MSLLWRLFCFATTLFTPSCELRTFYGPFSELCDFLLRTRDSSDPTRLARGERYEATPAEAVRPTPLLTGRKLIAAGYKPGAQFKEMLHAVEDAQLEGTIATAEEALALVRERFGAA